jgi:DNA-binding response OmpR family regulator
LKNVLVVDDDKTFTGLLRTVFELEGYQAVVVSSADGVLPAARASKPVLILMDVHAGQGDTLSVLRELRADEALKSVAVVMVSGMDRAEECLACGADRFLLKPFRPSELLAVVSDLINP